MTISAMFKRTRSGVRFLGKVSQTRSKYWEHIQEDARAGGRATRHGRSSHHHYPSLHFLSSSPLDAGKQVGNVDSRPFTTSVDFRLLLESGRDVSPAGWSPLNQEETIYMSLVPETIQVRRNASLGGMPD